MSSKFEAPPSQRRGTGLKVVVAFAAGAVVALAVSQVPTILYGGAQPTASSRVQPATVRQPSGASKSAVSQPSQAVADARENTATPAAETRPAATQAANPPAAAEGAEDKSCSWPYVDQRCAEADTNSGRSTQPVRVIPTDRGAPSTLTSAPAAPSESKQIGSIASSSPTPATPAAPPVAAAAPAQPSASTRGIEPPPPNVAPDVRRREPTRSKTVKSIGAAKKEARRSKASDQPSRTTRARAFDVPIDDATTDPDVTGSVIVRRYALPDGRRVTVYRQGRDEGYLAPRIPRRAPWVEDDDDDD
jgi:hypothetical protein